MTQQVGLAQPPGRSSPVSWFIRAELHIRQASGWTSDRRSTQTFASAPACFRPELSWFMTNFNLRIGGYFVPFVGPVRLRTEAGLFDRLSHRMLRRVQRSRRGARGAGPAAIGHFGVRIPDMGRGGFVRHSNRWRSSFCVIAAALCSGLLLWPADAASGQCSARQALQRQLKPANKAPPAGVAPIHIVSASDVPIWKTIEI